MSTGTNVEGSITPFTLRTFIISRDEAENVFVSQHNRLVDFSFAEPGALLSRGEDLHGDVLSAPSSAPHLAEPTLADNVNELDLAGYRPLH